MGAAALQFDEGVYTELADGASDAGGFILAGGTDRWEAHDGRLLAAPDGTAALVEVAERFATLLAFDSGDGGALSADSYLIELDDRLCTIQVHLNDRCGARFTRELAVKPGQRCYGRFAGGSVARRGTGLGRRFADHSLAVFAKMGATHVRVLAGDVGAYVWATAGFVPDRPAALAAKLLEATDHGLPLVENSASLPTWSLSDPQGAVDLLLRFAAGTATIGELARFGQNRPDRFGIHDGKKLLLSGVQWAGQWRSEVAAAPETLAA